MCFWTVSGNRVGERETGKERDRDWEIVVLSVPCTSGWQSSNKLLFWYYHCYLLGTYGWLCSVVVVVLCGVAHVKLLLLLLLSVYFDFNTPHIYLLFNCKFTIKVVCVFVWLLHCYHLQPRPLSQWSFFSDV